MDKLSVLIPSFNYDCSNLICTIASQMREGDELLVADDGSKEEEKKEKNRKACEKVHVRFIELDHNIGRAAIRNLLAQEAQGEWLIYIDNDSIIEDKSFIQKYLKEMGDHVVCGSLINPKEMPSKQQSLRFLYEQKYEKEFTWEKLNEQPYAHFRTSHFMIQREIMLAHPFDERFKLYGYEDTLFGLELQKAKVQVRHCNIQVINGDLEDNKTFLRKTEEQLETLYTFRDELKDCSILLNLYEQLKHKHLLWLISLLYNISKKAIRKNLLGNRPNISLYQFYKLGLYTEKANL